MGCVYQAKNRLNGMCYIGKTIQPLKKRINKHLTCGKRGYYFYRALKKYGFDIFEWTVLYESDDDKTLLQMEQEFIKLINTKSPNGYNLTDGSEGTKGHIVSQEAREKLRLANLGKKHSEEAKKKMSLKIVSEETKRKISETNRGRKHSEETKQKMRGRKHSEETRKNISAAKKGKKRPPFSKEWMENLSKSKIGRNLGHSVSAEARSKISAANKGRLNPAVGAANKNRIISSEARAKISAANKGRTRIFTEDHKKKLSEAAKQRDMKYLHDANIKWRQCRSG